MNKNILATGIIVLFILSSISPMVFGNNINYNEKSTNIKDPLVDYYGVYSLEEIPENIRTIISEKKENQGVPKTEDNIYSKESTEPLNDPMDSAWPMYCHDTRHTGRSPYSTVDTRDEIWRYKQDLNDYIRGSPVIDNNGIIYFGGMDFNALYPNGTMKWTYNELDFYVWSAPAINENGVIYIGDGHGFFHAINPNGTKKWIRYFANDIGSSPTIGNDGTIYFGDSDHYINALYPNNGSVKWRYKTGLVVYSSPAIGDDGTIYCGSHDTNLYALYPNNGTLKWKYKTGHWIRTSPCIADDGTIFVVSLDNFLHAVNPNGTLKWKTNMGEGGTSPTIGQDGTIYAGYTKLFAINPTNGSIKWTLNVTGKIKGSTPCHSLEDTIYFGTSNWLYAINSDGSLKWQEKIANEFIDSAPAIGSDGTIYVGSAWDIGGVSHGYLHAFGKIDPDAPSAPTINGQTSGTAGTSYDYTFKSTSPVGRDVYYYIDWGDGSKKDWFGPFNSGEEITVNHTWSKQGTYTIRARAKDTENLWGPWGELTVTMPRDKAVSNLILSFLERFPFLEKLLNLS